MFSRSSLTSLALAGAAAAHSLDGRAAPIGQVITSCTTPNTVAITFDDGPYIYTDEALNLLGNAGFKATFFLNGANFGDINDFASTITRMRAEGHQVGSHTWSHADLATLDAAGVTSEMTRVEDALLNIMGDIPTYMRPPYLSLSDVAISTLGSLGYHIISIDIDTLDYNLQDNIPAAAANFEAGLNAGGSISLEHDVHQNTVQQLIPRLISAVNSRGLTPVTVGECLGDPEANWYAGPRGGGSSPTTPPTTTPPANPGGNPPVSTDWSCGSTVGTQCMSGYCCSEYGWCGNTAEYCSSGCQTGFGTCS